MRIMIVDDNPVSKEDLSEIFSRCGVCDWVIAEREAINAFLLALKGNEPVKTENLKKILAEMGLIPEDFERASVHPAGKGSFAQLDISTVNHRICAKDIPSAKENKEQRKGDRYFRSVQALRDYQLEITMETGTTIHFDFRSRLNTARFGGLRDKELFRNVLTDGQYLIFEKAGRMPVKITASEFMDLVLIDRRK